MLEDSERKRIKRLMRARFTLGGLNSLVSDAGASFDDVVRQPANMGSAIMDILDDAERNGWTSDLLTALIDHFNDQPAPLTADIAEIEATLKALRERFGRGTALDDPFASCFARGGRPYINRPKVRDAFKKIAQPGGVPILIVNGPPDSGKSYSKELPSFVSAIQEQKSFRVFYCDLSENSQLWTAEKLVRSILLAWSLDEGVPAQLSQSSSHATELSEWLTSKTPKDQTWWIIIDSLSKITPDPGLLDFLNALASHIANTPRALRLVLLDMGDNPLPPSAELMTDRLTIDRWSATDLVDHYFKTLHTAQAAGNPFDAQSLCARAQVILDRVSAETDRVKRHTLLRDLLLEATTELGFG